MDTVKDYKTAKEYTEKKNKKDQKQLRKIRKEINQYVDGFITELNTKGLPFPSGGDCWYCLMKDTKGDTIGDCFHDVEHIKSHLKESYYVPSLLVNAFTESGYRKEQIGFHIDVTEKGFGKVSSEWSIRNVLKKYLKKRLYKKVIS